MVDARTLPDLLARRASATPSAPAFCVKRNAGWVPVTWADFARGAQAVARALAAYGVGRGDRVGILGPTCLEWEYVQWGALCVGATAVGLDPNYPDHILQAVTRPLHLAAIGVKDTSTLHRVPADIRRGLKLVALFDEAAEPSARTILLPRVVSSGYGPEDELGAHAVPQADDTAVMVFTSGTTGDPQPVTYAHGQVLLAIDEIVNAFPDIGPASRFACWLPLANLFQRIIDFCALRLGAASYIVSDSRALVGELRGISPSILIGVPRFYERLQSGISAELGAMAGLRGTVARWALRLAERRAAEHAAGARRVPAWLADRLVYSRVRAMFGPNLRYLVSGSAPMARWLLDWYETLGLPVYEAYGVSQDIVPVAMNRPDARRLGTVGKPLPANEVVLAEDGEITVGGPGVFRNAAAASSDDAAAPRRWPTGDLGRFDDEGYLTIVGRKAEVFKSAGGRWIAPQQIEAALRTLAYVDDVIVSGAGRPGIVALVSMNRERLPRTAQDVWRRDAQPSEHITRALQRDFARATASLPSEAQPRAVILSDHRFSIEAGELTSNLKLRRQAIEARHRAEIENAYRALAARPDGGASTYPLVLPPA